MGYPLPWRVRYTKACPRVCAPLVTVEGRNAKSRQTRHVPLNEEALSVLRRWREQSGSGMRVFDVVTGFRAAWEKILQRAGVSNFRWQDLRHHFASRLVQHGVSLNTVRDLLGHSTVGMSLRYAHLAPDSATRSGRETQ
jgi:integrase